MVRRGANTPCSATPLTCRWAAPPPLPPPPPPPPHSAPPTCLPIIHYPLPISTPHSNWVCGWGLSGHLNRFTLPRIRIHSLARALAPSPPPSFLPPLVVSSLQARLMQRGCVSGCGGVLCDSATRLNAWRSCGLIFSRHPDVEVKGKAAAIRVYQPYPPGVTGPLRPGDGALNWMEVALASQLRVAHRYDSMRLQAPAVCFCHLGHPRRSEAGSIDRPAGRPELKCARSHGTFASLFGSLRRSRMRGVRGWVPVRTLIILLAANVSRRL